MEPNTQQVVEGDREFPTETASSEVVHDVSAGADSDHIVHINSSEGVVTNPTQIESRSSKKKKKKSGKRRSLLTKGHYTIQVDVAAIVAAITIQNGSSDKESLVNLAVTVLANFVMALWVMSQRYYKHQVTWKAIICKNAFNFTWLLYYYVALSMLKPNWLSWWGFVIACIITTAYECFDELKSTMFTWCCEKVVLVMTYLIDKVFKPIRKDQAPPASAPTPASV